MASSEKTGYPHANDNFKEQSVEQSTRQVRSIMDHLVGKY